jgi:phosphate transport system permease protein
VSEKPNNKTRDMSGWIGIQRGKSWHPLEWLAEKMIFLVSLTAIVMVFLIFAFVTREALPVLFGQMNSAARQPVIQVADMDKIPPAKLQAYLGLTSEEFNSMDHDTKQLLVQTKIDEAKEAPADKDAEVNTLGWRYLWLPYQWTGYDRPVYIWQPVSDIKKYNLVPLVVGSIKATLVALLFAVPLSLAAAIYVSQLARPKFKEVLKPAIELLSGIPSVVVGFFALIVMATVLQHIFGYESRLNAFVAGIGLSFAIIPVVFSIAEDSLTSVPRSYTQAALALGASRWQAAWQVVLPAAIPGVFAAIVLGFGRAMGETMIVLLASGNASIMSWNIFDSTRTITATIAAEMGEVVAGGDHYRILFLIGAMLFVVTFFSNMAAVVVMERLKKRLEGKA